MLNDLREATARVKASSLRILRENGIEYEAGRSGGWVSFQVENLGIENQHIEKGMDFARLIMLVLYQKKRVYFNGIEYETPPCPGDVGICKVHFRVNT